MDGDAESRARAVAGRLARLVAGVLGDRARSVVLHGSLTLGGFRPGHSDIDLLAVAGGGLTDAQADTLEHRIRRADTGTAAGIDLHVVTAEAARTPAPPADVIAPVPAAWVVERGRHWLHTWLSLTDDAENAAFMALTACRIWRFALQNVHCSKAAAAAWALDRDPSLTAVRQAVAQDADPIASGDVALLLGTVLAETAPAGGHRAYGESR